MTDDHHVQFTHAERRMLSYLLDGRSHKEAAAALDVKLSTVRWHVRNLHAKTDTQAPVELVLWAQAHRECCVER